MCATSTWLLSVAISHSGIESAISDIDAYAESVEMTVASHKFSSRMTADNINQIACASDEISSNISQISQESGKAATKSADAMQFAGALGDLSVQLQDHVARFIGAVR
jgi:methyl-accepting chemotaxis protein